MPPARSPRTERVSPKWSSPAAAIGRDGAVTGAAGEVAPGTAASLRALARLLARQAAAEWSARMGDDAAATDITIAITPDAPIRDAA